MTAIAKAVAEWQSKKEAGLLEADKGYEENIYTTRKLKVNENWSRSLKS